ncbi:S1 family peptidase [Microbacterium hydrocarbonoxydans]|uniref:S1 family peptidase n=1 Tax=Microbacterium hydrocarbonoxydans TaxID=273678 RepID=UPI00203A40E3|nr:S1 family peptidase [Microbacterium hydrocarbonoxydans]MCM3781278.1 S1 family peptidase [Microbacterium hydrocarbonoxydans]
MKRLVIITAVLMALGAVLAHPVSASSDIANHDEPWSWSTATHPTGSAAVAGGSSGGGIWRWNGVDFIPSVGHMNLSLTSWRSETAPTGQGVLGRVSHTTGARTGPPDLALIATGPAPLNPLLRVSDQWTNAPLSDVAHGDIRKGTPLCHSGFSASTQSAGGYQCGQVYATCTIASGSRCIIVNDQGIASGGDSGGPVWAYDGRGGVILYGWVSGTLQIGDNASNGTYKYLTFEPVWNLQNKDWRPDETWTAGGFLSGPATLGCFVTTRGCIRS